MIADIEDGAALAKSICDECGSDAAASLRRDVSDESAVRALVAETVERFGRIDILVNNAALYAKLSPAQFRRMGRRDLGQGDGDQRARAVADGASRRAAHDRAEERQDRQYRVGHGLQGHDPHAALRHIERRDAGDDALAVARAWSRTASRSTRCRPATSLSETGLQNTAHVEEARERGRRDARLQRDQYPEDLIGALVFLVSCDSDFVTGQSLVVDGGSVNN